MRPKQAVVATSDKQLWCQVLLERAPNVCKSIGQDGPTTNKQDPAAYSSARRSMLLMTLSRLKKSVFEYATKCHCKVEAVCNRIETRLSSEAEKSNRFMTVTTEYTVYKCIQQSIILHDRV